MSSPIGPSTEQIVYTSSAVNLLVNHFSNAPAGEIYSFDQLNKICGRDVKKDRYIVTSVMRKLAREHFRVLINIRGKGYAIAQPREIPDISQDIRQSAKRKVFKAYTVCQTVDTSTLSIPDLERFIKEQSKAGLLLAVCKVIDNTKVLKKSSDQFVMPTEKSILGLLFKKENE